MNEIHEMTPEEREAAIVAQRAAREQRNQERFGSYRRSAKSDAGSRDVRAWFAGLGKWQRVAIITPIAIVLFVAFAFAAESLASAGRIHPRVQIADVSVGGMTQSRAAEVLEEQMSERFEEPVTLVFEEQSWSLESSQVAAVPQVDAMVAEAMAVGRTGGIGERAADRFSTWVQGGQLDPIVAADAEALAAVIDSIDTSVSVPPKDATILIEGTSASLQPAAVGIAMRREEVGGSLLKAFASAERELDVAVDFVPVEVTDSDAKDALRDAEKIMSGPVTVVHEDSSWEFSPDQIAAWISFRRVPVTEEATAASQALAVSLNCDISVSATGAVVPVRHRLEAFVDANEASATVSAKVGQTGRPAVDATFSARSGSVSIIPSQDGIGPDVVALAEEMTTELAGDGERVVELRTTRVEADLTTEEAEQMGIKERISTYTTEYSSGNKPRVNNIHTLADALDGTLIAPGGTFSFNETIGQRTAAKGYQEAPAIVNGKLVPQLGGGICQVGTTIFNTVFESGLPVVQRRNHSFYISHYPKGRDASVSWGGPDFKFKNDTPDWVLIATGYSSSSLTISLYGTDPGYEVTAKVGEWTNIKPHPVEEIEDPTLPEDTRVIEDSGVDGRSVVVKRIVRKGGTIVREDSFRSVYTPKTEVVKVGTLPVSEPETDTASAPAVPTP